MDDQIIISVGRQYGSGGHVIAQALAEHYGFEFFDKNLLREVARDKDVDVSELSEFDEIPKRHFFERTVKGYSSAPQDALALMQFDMLKRFAKEGKSFVIVGRCSEEVLSEYPMLVTIFVTAPLEQRIYRVMSEDGLMRHEAEQTIKQTDQKRRDYHNSHCRRKWGDVDAYDLIIDRSRLGVEGTTDFLKEYIDRRRALLRGV